MSEIIENLTIEYEKHRLRLSLSIDADFSPTVIDNFEFDDDDLKLFESGELVSYQLLICLDEQCIYIPTVILEKENPLDQLDIFFSESDILEQFFKYYEIEV